MGDKVKALENSAKADVPSAPNAKRETWSFLVRFLPRKGLRWAKHVGKSCMLVHRLYHPNLPDQATIAASASQDPEKSHILFKTPHLEP